MCGKSLWDSKWIKDLVSIQRISQSKCLSFFIGWTWLLSYGYLIRKNQIGCKKSLMPCFAYKVGYSVVKNWNQWNLYILASLMTNGKIGLNSIWNLCHLLCQIPLYFGLECYMSCMQSIFISHILIKINLLVSLQLIELHKVAYMIMQISSMLLSLFAWSDPVGDYSFAYIMTKRGSRMW